MSHIPGGRLPLLSTRPAVTLACIHMYNFVFTFILLSCSNYMLCHISLFPSLSTYLCPPLVILSFMSAGWMSYKATIPGCIFCVYVIVHVLCLQCFDAVCWVAGRPSGL